MRVNAVNNHYTILKLVRMPLVDNVRVCDCLFEYYMEKMYRQYVRTSCFGQTSQMRDRDTFVRELHFINSITHQECGNLIVA